MYALVDGNNFYCSCERVFQPMYVNVPVAVLSNNDGCIVARSQELKEVNIPVGAPLFKHRRILHKMRTAVFSSNYALYADMSARMMNCFRDFSQQQEIYSIDECFLKLSPKDQNEVLMHQMRDCVLQWTGLPVSVGIAPTKTLAKLANYYAKISGQGVYQTHSALTSSALSSLPVEKVWGIGTGIADRLVSRGFETVHALCIMPSYQLRQQFGVAGVRIQQELLGTPCQMLERTHPRKSILSSGSFGRKVYDTEAIEQFLASFIARAAERARLQGSVARGIEIFLLENDHIRGGGHTIKRAQACALNFAHADSRLLLAHGRRLLKQLYRPKTSYRKVGVILLDLMPRTQMAQDMFVDIADQCKAESLMCTIDMINQNMGLKTVRFAAEGRRRAKEVQQRSRSFTTSWKELPIVQAR